MSNFDLELFLKTYKPKTDSECSDENNKSVYHVNSYNEEELNNIVEHYSLSKKLITINRKLLSQLQKIFSYNINKLLEFDCVKKYFTQENITVVTKLNEMCDYYVTLIEPKKKLILIYLNK
ncbi:putative orfan [Tupanvirus soda lake]|uniref:Orfan n=2 Tax=Tupanvirus TaxID=2094720 RepID=A0AC62ACW7_9VIRU|nr:putative orfan [Tupanvirus soda lake]QKU35632.1 putative orfan [Tupanvirus soda lake]